MGKAWILPLLLLAWAPRRRAAANEIPAAEAVRAAVAADDGPRLRALASLDDPDPWVVADVLLERGNCLTMLGEYDAGHEQLMTALDLAGELELPPEVPRHDAARGYQLGRLYRALGDDERALALFRQALARATGEGDARFAGTVRRAIVALQVGRGDYEVAQATLEAQLEQARQAHGPLAVADILSLLAHVAYRRGRPEEARRLWTETEAIYVDLRVPLWLTRVRLDLVRVDIWEERYEAARSRLDQALAAAERLQLTGTLARAYGLQALIHLRTGELDAARQWARRGVDQAVFVGRRLAEGEGAEVRAGLLELYETGALAAARSGHAEDLFFFLEGSRAATLLESLDGAETLRSGAVPADLRLEETTARTTEVRALAAYRRAVRDGVLEDMRQARADLDAARGSLQDVVLDIQRKARARGSNVLPRPVALAAARSQLAADEALVLYGLTQNDPIALVVRRDGERIVELGSAGSLRAELDALLTDEEPYVRPEAVEALARRLLGRLGLGEDVRRLVVSPDGELARVPFSLLAPERPVVFAPSASAWMLLETRPVERGKRVLAYGDPTYGVEQAGPAPSRLRRGGSVELGPLPATAEEARAVGDLIRLHEDASETHLRADLATGSRWRAVHLACHGLLDVDRPAFSALALSTDDANDGFLTALDVYRMQVPTDLAVLSACETGRGRTVAGEGLFGLPRAFLHAGASTVLVSLWPVDDEATQALMARFYAAWSPRGDEGAEPVSAAAALEQAQAWLRAQPRWRHPRFWAGWVLWGRAD